MKLSKKHIEVLLAVLYPHQDSDFFWEDNNGKHPRPKETATSKQKDKLLNEGIKILEEMKNFNILN